MSEGLIFSLVHEPNLFRVPDGWLCLLRDCSSAAEQFCRCCQTEALPDVSYPRYDPTTRPAGSGQLDHYRPAEPVDTGIILLKTMRRSVQAPGPKAISGGKL